MAGVAEEVASVVDPLVDGVAGGDRDDALVGADEEQDDGGGEEDEGRPGGELRDRDRGDLDLSRRWMGRRWRPVTCVLLTGCVRP